MGVVKIISRHFNSWREWEQIEIPSFQTIPEQSISIELKWTGLVALGRFCVCIIWYWSFPQKFCQFSLIIFNNGQGRDDCILGLQNPFQHMKCWIPPRNTLLFGPQLRHTHLALSRLQLLCGYCALMEEFHHHLHFVQSGLHHLQAISYYQVDCVHETWVVGPFQDFNSFGYVCCVVTNTAKHFVLYLPLFCHS